VALGLGAAGWLHVMLLLAWIALVAGVGWRHFRRRRDWTGARLEMTNDLIERMVGHRTRLAQESPERWHDGEDRAVERYLTQSTTMDGVVALQSVIARGWPGLSFAPALNIPLSFPVRW
jgi:ATP-binding cassette, subfamily B, bacterial